MVNLVGSITTNLLNADLYSRCTNTALGVYAVAKAKGDTSTMERAIGYAEDTCATANDAASKIDDDIKKSLKEARAEEKEKAQKAKEAEANSEKTDAATSEDQLSQDNVEKPGIDTANADTTPSGNYSNGGTVDTTIAPGTALDIQV